MIDRPPAGCSWEHQDRNADVLFVTNMWPDAERPVYGIFVQRQVESLRQEGIRCDVLYVRGYRGFRTYPVASGWLLRNSRGIRDKYRLIHAHAGETALVVSPVIGLPKVASYCGDDILGKADDNGAFSHRAVMRRWLVKQSARFCTLTITKSAEMDRALPASTRKRNTVVPNGIDEREFFPLARSDARRKLGWDQQERIVVFVATRPHEPRKRLSLAQAAVSEAERTVGPIRLSVAENVPPSELPLMMSAADGMLLTSRMEGSPNAVKEALMCNLPVVSTDVGDVAELLDGVEHSTVCTDAPNDLGAALAAILQNPQRSNGREKRRELTQSAIAARILRLYSRAGYRPVPDPA